MTEENNNANGGENSSPEMDPLKQAQDEATKWKTDFLYLKAEFDNYKKHAIKERSDLLKYGSERVVRDLLDVIDNFERALGVKVTSENLATYTQGVEMTAKALKEALSKHGVVEVASDLAPFDPNIHEALSSEESSQVQPGHILRTFKKAYKLHDKVLRPAQVVVAKAPSAVN